MPKIIPTLIDHHGPWCAQCLDYFKSGVEEYHHVYPKWSTAGSPATKALVWFLPVHRKDCHRKGLQRRSDAAGLTLGDVLAKADINVRRSAETAYYSGNFNLAFMIELELARRTKAAGNIESFCDHLLNAATSASGSSLPAVWRALETFDPDATIEYMSRSARARWALAVGNLYRNSYRLNTAAARYETAAAHLESLSTSARSLYRPAYLRRIVSLEPSVSIAREAVDLARDARDPWGQRTADLIEGWSI